MDRSDARGCHSSRRAGMAQSCAPAVSDKLARKRCARQSAARQLPPSDAEIVGGGGSLAPSLQCGRRDALFRLILAARITFAHLAVSDLMTIANSSGELRDTSRPSCACRFREAALADSDLDNRHC